MTITSIKKLLKDFKDEPTGNEFLDNRYDPNSKYYRFFYQLTKKFKPKVVVELGSWQGTSAAYFAGGNPDTLVITVDHHTDPGDEGNENMTIAAEKKFDNLRYCKGWTCNEIYEEEKDQHILAQGQNAFPKVKDLLNGHKIDVLFIDSWHVYHQAVRDWNAYKPLLSKGALVIVDDVLKGTEGSAIDGIEQFWNELKGAKHLDSSLHTGYPMGFFKDMKIHGNVKCDCGHKQKDHYKGSGWCHDSTHPKAGQCGCTWFYPNVKYIKSQQTPKK